MSRKVNTLRRCITLLTSGSTITENLTVQNHQEGHDPIEHFELCPNLWVLVILNGWVLTSLRDEFWSYLISTPPRLNFSIYLGNYSIFHNRGFVLAELTPHLGTFLALDSVGSTQVSAASRKDRARMVHRYIWAGVLSGREQKKIQNMYSPYALIKNWFHRDISITTEFGCNRVAVC